MDSSINIANMEKYTIFNFWAISTDSKISKGRVGWGRRLENIYAALKTLSFPLRNSISRFEKQTQNTKPINTHYCQGLSIIFWSLNLNNLFASSTGQAFLFGLMFSSLVRGTSGTQSKIVYMHKIDWKYSISKIQPKCNIKYIAGIIWTLLL